MIKQDMSLPIRNRFAFSISRSKSLLIYELSKSPMGAGKGNAALSARLASRALLFRYLFDRLFRFVLVRRSGFVGRSSQRMRQGTGSSLGLGNSCLTTRSRFESQDERGLVTVAQDSVVKALNQVSSALGNGCQVEQIHV